MQKTMMKAIIHTKFGPAEELQLKEIDKPVPKDKEVLIKVKASTVTSTDCNARNSTFVPTMFVLFAKLFIFGVFKPRINILGLDVAGEVEAIGKDVTKFKVGDKVFGSVGLKFGAHAEYACVSEDGVLTIKPDSMTWEDAAAVYLAGSTAVYYVKDMGKVKAGQKILINGASGAIGTYAIQLAKYYGAEVTAVCSGGNAELVKSLGADKVIDYTKEDFTKNGEIYDVIMDTVGKLTYSRCKKSITKEGLYLQALIRFPDVVALLLNGSKKIKAGAAHDNVEGLLYLKELVAEGKIKPVIDKVYPLEQTAEAFKYAETFHKKGTLVITIG